MKKRVNKTFKDLKSSSYCSPKKFGINCYLALFSLFIFVLNAVFIFSDYFKEYQGLVGNIFVCVLSFIALLSVILLYIKFPVNFPMEKKAKFFLILALSFFLIGDLFWLIHEIFLNQAFPIGSWPDFSWNLAYWFLIVSMVFLIRTEFTSSNKFLIFMIIGGLILGGFFLGRSIYEGVINETFNFAYFVQDLYPFYDSILLGLIIVLLAPLFLESSLSKPLALPWFLLGAGIITRLIYDILFIEMTNAGSYYTGHPFDLIYVSFYVFVTFYSAIKCRFLNK